MLLTDEQRDDFEDLLTHPGMKSLMIVLDELATHIEHDILKLQLDGSNHTELLMRKVRGEGARKLVVAMKQRIVKSVKR